MKNHFFNIILLFSIITFFCSCTNDSDIDIPIKVEVEKPTLDKVILVYAAFDNSLDNRNSQIPIKMRESLIEGWDMDTNTKIIILSVSKSTSPTLSEITVENGIKVEKTIETYSESENTASPEFFTSIIEKVKKMYTADKYGLIIASHANGWLPDINRGKKTFSVLDDNNRAMELYEFANAIPDNSFEYIMFEACLMAGIEVVYELRNKCDYIVASSAELNHYGFVYAYPQATKILSKNGLYALKMFSNEVYKVYSDPNTSKWSFNSITLSIIKTEGLEELAGWIKSNCDYNMPLKVLDVQSFKVAESMYVQGAGCFFDFEDYFSRLLKTKKQKKELKQKLDDLVVWKKNTATFKAYVYDQDIKINKHSGLTSYIPQKTGRFLYYNQMYGETAWAKAIGIKIGDNMQPY